MVRAKLKFRLHRAVIVLICLALLVALMQGASWFSQNSQKQRNPQLEELARTLAQQVTLNLAPLMRSETPDESGLISCLSSSPITAASSTPASMTNRATWWRALAKASRFATAGAGRQKSRRLLQPADRRTGSGKNGPLGYLRLTLDTHTLATEAKQVDNTTNILRLMLLLSLAIGVVLTRTLLQGKRTRWQQSPFLLTANKPVRMKTKMKRKGNL
jgi:membrane protein